LRQRVSHSTLQMARMTTLPPSAAVVLAAQFGSEGPNSEVLAFSLVEGSF
jgi:hypothetical protein